MISQVTNGLELPIILTMISEYLIFFKFEFSKKKSRSIHGYATVTTSKGALIIGGSEDSELATVACYNDVGWSKLQDLQSTRTDHRAIINGDQVYVIGGRGTK